MMGLLLLSTGCKKEDDNSGNKKAYEGTFNAHEECISSNNDYEMTVTAGAGDTIMIGNFANITQGQEVTIGLLQNNIVTVPEQQFETFNYRGSGTFNTSTNTYTFRFSVDDLPTYIDSCVVTTVKQ